MNDFYFHSAASSSSFELSFVFSLDNIFHEKILVFIFELFFPSNYYRCCWSLLSTLFSISIYSYFNYSLYYFWFHLNIIFRILYYYFIQYKILICVIFFSIYFSGYFLFHFLCDNLGLVCVSVFQEWSSIINNSCSCERKWK